MSNPPVPSPSGAAQETLIARARNNAAEYEKAARRILARLDEIPFPDLADVMAQAARDLTDLADALASQHQLREALHALEQEMRQPENQSRDYHGVLWADRLSSLLSGSVGTEDGR